MNKYVIKKFGNMQYYWILEDIYGGFLMKSPIYPTKEACERSIHHSKNSLDMECFKKQRAVNGQYYFTQVSSEHNYIVATGKMYADMIDRDIDITLVKSMAKFSEVIDSTLNAA